MGNLCAADVAPDPASTPAPISEKAAKPKTSADSPTGFTYSVDFRGVPERGLKAEMRDLSETVELQDHPPASRAMLRRRADADLQRLLPLMRFHGWYAAAIDVAIEGQTPPLKVVFTVTPGPRFLLLETRIAWVDHPPFPEPVPSADRLGLRAGEPFQAADVPDTQARLHLWLQRQGHPFPTVTIERIIVDHATNGVQVEMAADPGPVGYFGEVTLTGLTAVDPEWVRNRIPWHEGDRFDQDELDRLRRRLINSDLFHTVNVRTAPALDDDDRLSIQVELIEREARTLRLGAGYTSDGGPDARIGWENRNLTGHADRLSLDLSASAIERLAEADYRLPDFLRVDQTLHLNTRVLDENPEAFDSRSLRLSAVLENRLRPGLDVSYGIAYRILQVEQLGESDNFALLSFPLTLNHDTSDDLLNPVRGGRLALAFTPFYDTLGSGLWFVRGEAGYRRYWQISDSPWLVLAGRAKIGSIAGASRDDVPADERFYSGGGGSLRGYPYKTVGPLRDGEPIGGLSLFETSLELRAKITRRIGIVAFLDGGSAFDAEVPDLQQDLRWGTGLGLRYYTAIGPVRLDFAVPLQRREGLDDAFQVYISIGQAF